MFASFFRRNDNFIDNNVTLERPAECNKNLPSTQKVTFEPHAKSEKLRMLRGVFVIKSNLHSLPSFSFGGKNTDLRSWCTRIFIGNLMNKNLKTKKIVMTSKRSFHANDTRTCSVCRPPNSLKLDSLKLHNPEPQDYLILQNELCVVLIFRCYTIWAPGCNTSQRNTKKKEVLSSNQTMTIPKANK